MAPVKGMAVTAPAAIAKSAKPNTAGPTSRRSLAKGMWGTQEPTMIPWSKKRVKVAQQAWVGALIFMMIPGALTSLNSLG
jgi:hypothetical protein